MSNPFGPLQKLREKPLPPAEPLMALRKGYRGYPLRLDDPRDQEPLVDITRAGIAGETFYHSPRNPPYYMTIPGAPAQPYLRQGVVDRLALVQQQLASAGLELWIYDGWRPTSVQSYFYNQWMPAEVRRRYPHFTSAQVTEEVEKYWAKPAESLASPSPHLTGSAVDCELRWKNGRSLWFGSLFDDTTALSNTAHFETLSSSMAFSDEEARANRRLLYWIMTEAGFANNPTEWWHFSYGDQMWAKLTQAPYAFYGAAQINF